MHILVSSNITKRLEIVYLAQSCTKGRSTLIFGLKYGMLRFNPLTIKRDPNNNIKIGRTFLILFLNFILIKLESNTAVNIIGNVPNPKANIKKAPSTIFPVAIDPPIAAYTNPHGNNPFNKPINNKFRVEEEVSNLLRPYFIFEM